MIVMMMSMLTSLKKRTKGFFKKNAKSFFDTVDEQSREVDSIEHEHLEAIYILFRSQLVHIYHKFQLFYDSMFTKPMSKTFSMQTFYSMYIINL